MKNIIENFNDENREVIGDDGFGQYININNLSIIKVGLKKKKSNDVNGSAKIVMDLESFTETRDIILKYFHILFL